MYHAYECDGDNDDAINDDDDDYGNDNYTDDNENSPVTTTSGVVVWMAGVVVMASGGWVVGEITGMLLAISMWWQQLKEKVRNCTANLVGN